MTQSWSPAEQLGYAIGAIQLAERNLARGRSVHDVRADLREALGRIDGHVGVVTCICTDCQPLRRTP